jgi:hypothetical protein
VSLVLGCALKQIQYQYTLSLINGGFNGNVLWAIAAIAAWCQYFNEQTVDGYIQTQDN